MLIKKQVSLAAFLHIIFATNPPTEPKSTSQVKERKAEQIDYKCLETPKEKPVPDCTKIKIYEFAGEF